MSKYNEFVMQDNDLTVESVLEAINFLKEKDGLIIDCDESMLISLLEELVYPSLQPQRFRVSIIIALEAAKTMAVYTPVSYNGEGIEFYDAIKPRFIWELGRWVPVTTNTEE